MSKKLPTLLPKIIILHGWSFEPDLKNRWQAVIKGLEAQGLLVEYLDLPGFEISLSEANVHLKQLGDKNNQNKRSFQKSSNLSKTGGDGWSLDEYAQYVLSCLSKESNVVILGHSFGGQLAVRVAVTHPSWLKGLILIGPAGIVDRSWPKIFKRSLFSGLSIFGKKLLLGAGVSSSHSFYQSMRQLFLQLAGATDYRLSSTLMKKTMNKVLSTEILNDLDDIDLPSLIFWGTRDRFTPVKHASLFASRLSHSHLVILEGDGHRPYFTQPDMLLSHISHFLLHYVV
ncbi:MAG TPA: alpha/beta hydrolase [Candidatus Woesebacteria bacterium]|nr:alpha/beta hydrolase [Candidatus Woesebacteria bacterium]